MKKSAFTLVELIIVITILTILATIGFMSYGSYTTDARDGKRKTDLREIRKGLEIYQLKNQILPKPEEQLLTIKTGATILSYQGYLGKEIQKTIRLTSETKDSKDNNYYTYSTNGNQTKYQLLAMLENNPNNISFNNNILNNNEILNKAFSIDYTNRYSYTIGNKLGIFLSGTTNEPLQETLTGVDLSGTTPTYKIVFNTTSGNITSSGSDLYTQIISNQGTGGTATQTNSCTTQPSYTNAIFTIGTPTSVGQAWQNTNSGNPCYYTCTGGYSGNDCTIKIGSVSTFPGLSCNDIKTKITSSVDGTYWIDPDGVTVTISPLQVYCDMTTDGGGWTLFSTINAGGDTTLLLTDNSVGVTNIGNNSTSKLHSSIFTKLINISYYNNPIKMIVGNSIKYFGNGKTCNIWEKSAYKVYGACTKHFDSLDSTICINEGDLNNYCNMNNTESNIRYYTVFLGGRADFTNKDIMYGVDTNGQLGITNNQSVGYSGSIWIK